MVLLCKCRRLHTTADIARQEMEKIAIFFPAITGLLLLVFFYKLEIECYKSVHSANVERMHELPAQCHYVTYLHIYRPVEMQVVLA